MATWPGRAAPEARRRTRDGPVQWQPQTCVVSGRGNLAECRWLVKEREAGGDGKVYYTARQLVRVSPTAYYIIYYREGED